MEILGKREANIENMGDCRIGDQITVGKYTATCQKVTDDTAVFLLDQYLDKTYRMKPTNTNEDDYEASELRRTLQVVAANDENFASIRERMRPFDNGDLIRIPTVREIFGNREFYKVRVDDDAEQWELMKDRRNRIAEREEENKTWGWLQNKTQHSKPAFTYMGVPGFIWPTSASYTGGVRPVFQLLF